ncbi:hypothetical protein HOY80DRAFT_1134568 [Tuber brumale]|nr:hypothetical protein HOY80DRAFT_1134568 [Tuber brumale]
MPSSISGFPMVSSSIPHPPSNDLAVPTQPVEFFIPVCVLRSLDPSEIRDVSWKLYHLFLHNRSNNMLQIGDLLHRSRAGKRGNNARLLGGNVGYVGRILEEDLGIIATAAIGALVVLKGWLWYRDICKARAVFGVERGMAALPHLRIPPHSLFKASLLITPNALEKSLANIGSLAVGLTMARSHLHSSPSCAYAYISLDNIFYEAASGNYSDTLEESGVVPLLTSSNSIDSCLDSITALLSFTTATVVCLYMYSVQLNYFESTVHIKPLLGFTVWVGFQVSVLCMIPLRSGTTTIFTILASSPVALKRYVPAQYYKTLEASPGIGVEDVWTP